MNHPKQKGKKVPEQLNTTLNMAKKYKKKAIKKILRREAKEKDEYETGALLPNGLPRKWRFCGFKDCDYRTQYKANLNRHQNHYGHRDVRLNEDAEIKKNLKVPVCDNELVHVPPAQKVCNDTRKLLENNARLSSDGSLKDKRYKRL